TNIYEVEGLGVDLGAGGAYAVDGVDFDVVAKRELRAEARRKAVAAARGKAELYAEAAGVRLGAVLHIEDVDPDRVGPERYRSHSSAQADASDQDLAPGHVVVSAAVTLGFDLARD
ncbi:SIMPL domain-containing protein, partial [Asanoa sp. NPDC050611]|uniref:SIMPL domain-containing protein n=1 Tax=Asanoa sp. NPDC050611 TaxID=3157098 RepID=UPI0033C033B5